MLFSSVLHSLKPSNAICTSYCCKAFYSAFSKGSVKRFWSFCLLQSDFSDFFLSLFKRWSDSVTFSPICNKCSFLLKQKLIFFMLACEYLKHCPWPRVNSESNKECDHCLWGSRSSRLQSITTGRMQSCVLL